MSNRPTWTTTCTLPLTAVVFTPSSGIPNHAFYVTATTLGGQAWDAPGNIWYDALLDPKMTHKSTFALFAGVTLRHARSRYGVGSNEAQAVQAGWEAVKVRVR